MHFGHAVLGTRKANAKAKANEGERQADRKQGPGTRNRVAIAQRLVAHARRATRHAARGGLVPERALRSGDAVATPAAPVAAAATVAVVYPHMNSIGGDAFWLMHVPGHAPGVIDGSGAAANAASIDWYRAQGIQQNIPFRGGLAANTVAGAVASWEAAYRPPARKPSGNEQQAPRSSHFGNISNSR